MKIEAKTVKEYIDTLPEERQVVFKKIRSIFKKHIPKGFKEQINYNMPAWVVPLSAYPDGYHCNPKLPLPFISIASQKNFVALYHMGVYANPDLYTWFVSEYPNHSKRKLDMGKSCFRFKKMDDIPYDLITQLIQKMTMEDWVQLYEKNIKKN